MIIRIKRQDNRDSVPYYQSFKYDGTGRKTVAGILEELNYLDDLVDIDGNVVRRISWSCSCMQKTCGACAMVVNKTPALACSYFIDCSKEESLLLEPLTKFPVVCDLIVDRSIIFDYALQASMYLDKIADSSPKEASHQYEAAKCLKCGLCLEVCCNYLYDDKEFYGPLFANEAYLNYTLSDNRKNEILDEYQRHFGHFCSKALSCREICPVHMPTLTSITFMNGKHKIKK